MLKTSVFIENNKLKMPNNYQHTSMVSHRGVVVSFAMREDCRIYYNVLNLSNGGNSQAQTNDKENWLKTPKELQFPRELAQVGYNVLSNRTIPLRNAKQEKIEGIDIASSDMFYSTTARLTANEPFQVLSDGQYIYLFRQSVAANAANNEKVSNTQHAMVDNTLLVDRFILSGTELKRTREIRYQRSRHKTEPKSKKDTLSSMDMDKKPFYEPTCELAFTKNLVNGGFSVLLIPVSGSEDQRWQIFHYDSQTKKINSTNIKYDSSIVFDPSDTQSFLTARKKQYTLPNGFTTAIQNHIKQNNSDDNIAKQLKKHTQYAAIPQDELIEVVYAVRTGVAKDDFSLAGGYQANTGLTSTYYYQQEEGVDGKPMKNKACIMLAMGLSKQKEEKNPIGILNFAVTDTGRLSRLLKDQVTLPPIKMVEIDKQKIVKSIDEKKNEIQKIKETINAKKTKFLTTISGPKDKLKRLGSPFPLIFPLVMVGNTETEINNRLPKFSDLGEKDSCEKHTQNMAICNTAINNTKIRIQQYNKAKKTLEAENIAQKNTSTQANNFEFLLRRGEPGNNIDDRQLLSHLICYEMHVLSFYQDKMQPSLVKLNNLLNEKEALEQQLMTGKSALKMDIISLDANGLSVSGGLLTFADTSGCPYIFDDSLGRVNLYFQGEEQGFYAAYFNPKGGKNVTSSPAVAQQELSFKPRLDLDMTLNVAANIENTNNSCSLFITNAKNKKTVETWHALPIKSTQVAAILNGKPSFVLGSLAKKYTKPNAGQPLKLEIHTQANNSFMPTQMLNSSHQAALASATGATIALSNYLDKNLELTIAGKTFSLIAHQKVKVKMGQLHKNQLADIVKQPDDMSAVWQDLQDRKLINADGAIISDKLFDQTAALYTDTAPYAYLDQKLRTLIQTSINQRILTLSVTDTNTSPIDSLDQGLSVNTHYNYKNFTCIPTNLEKSVSPQPWMQKRSYVVQAHAAIEMPMAQFASITYDIKNSVGQWEPGDPGMAISFHKSSNGTQAILSSNEKLSALAPTKQGLSLEAWIKPNAHEVRPEDEAKKDKDTAPKANESLTSIIYYKKGIQHYQLGIERTGNQYTCFACLDNKKITTKIIKKLEFDRWTHLAFTYKKYWGLKLDQTSIDCGNDASLNLDGDFSIEILARIDTSGTLLKKTGEYALSINDDNQIEFSFGGRITRANVLNKGNNFITNAAATVSHAISDFTGLDELNIFKASKTCIVKPGKFSKITIIRSTKKPKDITASIAAQKLASSGNNENEKWYENKKDDTKTLLQKMAAKQDAQEKKMSQYTENFSGTNGIGMNVDSDQQSNQKRYTSIIVCNDLGEAQTWTSSEAIEIENPNTFSSLNIGSGDFTGTFAGIRVWNRALSTDEAKKTTISSTKTGLLAYWRMTEAKNKYIYDDANTNHGVIQDETKSTWVESPDDGLPKYTLYIDGQALSCETTHYTSPTSLDQISLAGYQSSTSIHTACLHGVLEEIRIWNLPRTAEQISDNGFTRLKGEREQLLANYTFDDKLPAQTDMAQKIIHDSSQTAAHLTAKGIFFDNIGHVLSKENLDKDNLRQVPSTAPVSTETPQVRSILAGLHTDYNGTITSMPGVVEYGDVQKNDDGTLIGILKRCYSFVDKYNVWNLVTGYKVGDLITQWYGQAQFSPQVTGYLEGAPPVPGENFPIEKDSDLNDYNLDNSISFEQAEEVSYNYATSKEHGFGASVESELKAGIGTSILAAPMGFGVSFKLKMGMATASNWETNGSRSHSFEKGISTNVNNSLSASLAGYDGRKKNPNTGKMVGYYRLGNTGYALVKSKTADIYLLRLAHNNALVSITWQPNPDLPEDINIIPFPINPLYIKQGTLDGKFGEGCDDHYPLSQGFYGEYSYFKPKEAYKIKKQINRKRQEIENYYSHSFDTSSIQTDANALNGVTALTGRAQSIALIPGIGASGVAAINGIGGQVATYLAYSQTETKKDLAKVAGQRNLVNTYVWTIEGGFYAESTEIAQTQQETYASDTALSLSGGVGVAYDAEEGAPAFEQKTLFSSSSNLTMTKSKTKSSSKSFGINVNIELPTSPRYQYAGSDGRSLSKGLITPGTVDAYRFMSFYLEPKAENFSDLFSQVIDPKWLEESSDPNAQALRQARGTGTKKPCWRIMHRVTYVSRILPEFTAEAPPSLEKTLRMKGLESNYMLIKKFEPYLREVKSASDLSLAVDKVVDQQLPEFSDYKAKIKSYLELYYNLV